MTTTRPPAAPAQPDHADGPAAGAAAPGRAPTPMAVLAARYGRAFDIAVVVVVAGWHVAGAGSELVPDHALYASYPAQVAAWTVMGLVIAAGSVRLLRGHSGAAWAWTLAAIALAVSTAAALGCPAARLLMTDWAWGTAGWIGVLVLLRRPLAELAVFLTAETAATLAVLARDGLDRAGLAGFITILVQTTAIQLVVAIAARGLGSTAREAAGVAQSEAAAREKAVIAQRLQAARQARWLALQETAGPLLSALADGSADPGDPELRRACAVEAARLRRLMAESDDAPSSLQHELLACADIAERRGAAVDIDTVGTLPELPAEVRRVITDTAIAVLTTAASRARITLLALPGGVAVSLVADSPAGPELPVPAAGVAVECQRDSRDVWVEARWGAEAQ